MEDSYNAGHKIMTIPLDSGYRFPRALVHSLSTVILGRLFFLKKKEFGPFLLSITEKSPNFTPAQAQLCFCLVFISSKAKGRWEDQQAPARGIGNNKFFVLCAGKVMRECILACPNLCSSNCYSSFCLTSIIFLA